MSVRELIPDRETLVTGDPFKGFYDVDEAKLRLGITHSEHDDLITGLIASAVAEVEQTTNLSVRDTEITAEWDCPASDQCLRLSRTPLYEVSEVHDGSSELTFQTEYETYESVNHADVRLVGDRTWSGDPVVVIYTAKVVAGSRQLPLLRTLVGLLVNGYYENREGYTDRPITRSPAVDGLVRALKVPRLWETIP